jgi:membrane-bound lytic murein transglycosylase A
MTSAQIASMKNHAMPALLLAAAKRLRGRLVALGAALLAAACVTAPPTPPPAPPPSLPATYRPVDFRALPDWGADQVELAWPAFRVGCTVLTKPAAPRAALWSPVCAAAENVDATDAAAIRSFFETHFIPYQVLAADGGDSGTITGYYEPLLAGSRAKSERYAVPLYAVPDDLLTIDLVSLYPELKGKRLRGRVDGRKVVPYWSRAEIENGKAPLDGKVLVYVADPVEAFFLQIQGSGRVALDDGSVVRVGYADQNGHPYRSIARVLIDRGEIEASRASMQGIREWGRRHPAELPALLDENPSYVFFREVPAPAPGTLEARIDGPIGTLGVPLAAGRTLAVDTRSIPLGAPVFLATTYPLSETPLRRLMLAEDTGGAIRGALRADFFWGFGDDAGREAGRMKQDGRMWILWPKDAGPPKSDS